MPNHVIVAELLSRNGFPLAANIYGQVHLKLDLLANLRHCRAGPIEWHLLGTNLHEGLVSYAKLHHVHPSTEDPLCYVQTLDALCRTGKPVIVFASFAQIDQMALYHVGLLRRKHKRLRLVVILHCLKEEYVRTLEEVTTYSASDDSVTQQNLRSLKFLMLFHADYEWNLVDRFLAVSPNVEEGFAQPDPYLGRPLIRREKMQTLLNGVDSTLYDLLNPERKEFYRGRMGMNAGWVVGTTSGWKQYKGCRILEKILAIYAERQDTPDIMIPFLPGYSGQILLSSLQDPSLRRLVENRRVHLFFDVSQWRTIGFDDVAACHYEKEILASVQSLCKEKRSLFASCWRGILRFPAQQIMDIYLRPSLAEAFGRGLVEAMLCGSLPLVTDRGFMPTVVTPDLVVPLPDAVRVRHHHVRGSDEEAQAILLVADEFVRRADNLRLDIGGERPSRIRTDVINKGVGLSRMVCEYEGLIERLSTQ